MRFNERNLYGDAIVLTEDEFIQFIKEYEELERDSKWVISIQQRRDKDYPWFEISTFSGLSGEVLYSNSLLNVTFRGYRIKIN